MTTVFKTFNSYKQFVKYAFFGGIGVLADIIIYSLLVYFQFNYQAANASGYLSGTLISFFLNRHYTFNVKDKIYRRLFMFLTIAFIGYISSAILLYVLIEKLFIDMYISKFLTLFFVLLVQYALNKKVTFKSV